MQLFAAGFSSPRELFLCSCGAPQWSYTADRCGFCCKGCHFSIVISRGVKEPNSPNYPGLGVVLAMVEKL